MSYVWTNRATTPPNERQQVSTFTDPRTNKSYSFNSIIVPLSRISTSCQDEVHSNCTSDPQTLIKFLDLQQTKLMCCLCNCHGEDK